MHSYMHMSNERLVASSQYPGSAILLQIVMVSHGSHLVKNHESQSRTNESQFKKNESKIENAWDGYVTRQLI